jgi:hypothetical protein
MRWGEKFLDKNKARPLFGYWDIGAIQEREMNERP